MAFKTDGSVHYSGIANEGKTAQILNSINYFPDEVITVGGTKHKEDAVAGSLKVSAKDKKRLSSGSFDWLNTSRYNSLFGTHFDWFKDMIKILRKEEIYARQSVVDEVRDQFASLCSDAFDVLTKDQVCDLIIGAISDGIDFVFVNDKENNVLYQFDPENHPAIKFAKECDSIELVSSQKAQSSRKVIFIKDGVEYDCGLRLRVTSNNGIKALLGLSKSNKNSQVVIKLQQDAVHRLVKEHIDCKTISY